MRRTDLQPRRAVLSFGLHAVAFLALASSCERLSTCGKSDADLAKMEREKANEKWRDSRVVLPWRVLKGSVRSRDADPRPEVYSRFDAALNAQTNDARSKDLAVYFGWLLLHSDEVAKHDEDDFPMLLPKMLAPAPAPPFYDNGMEHLTMAAVVLLLDLADKGDSLPVGDLLFYELARAEPKPDWPKAVSTFVHFFRGAAFFANKFHYAADEELTTYLTDVEGLTNEELAIVAELASEALVHSKLPKEEGAKKLLLALGYFLRAANRAALDRKEPSVLDLEKGLEALEALGIENEVTLWAWTLVHQQRERYDKAAASLEKLRESPHLDADAKKELGEIAERMRDKKSDPGLFAKQATTLLVLRAAVQRAGGPVKVLGVLVGEETATKIVAPFSTFDSIYATIEKEQSAAIDSLKEGSKSGLDALKSKASAWKDGIAP